MSASITDEHQFLHPCSADRPENCGLVNLSTEEHAARADIPAFLETTKYSFEFGDPTETGGCGRGGGGFDR